MNFINHYSFNAETRDIPEIYQGTYQRVKINKKSLALLFFVEKKFIIIRNPDEIKYEIVYFNDHYCIKGKDGVHGGKVGFYEASSGNKYMLYDGTLYKKISE